MLHSVYVDFSCLWIRLMIYAYYIQIYAGMNMYFERARNFLRTLDVILCEQKFK